MESLPYIHYIKVFVFLKFSLRKICPVHFVVEREREERERCDVNCNNIIFVLINKSGEWEWVGVKFTSCPAHVY